MNRNAFFIGAAGFLAMGSLITIIVMTFIGTYQHGYDQGFKCGRYNINCQSKFQESK